MAKPESSWRELAACQFIDPELFFPNKGGSADAPKRVCNTMCDVREQCLEAAMREEYGLSKTHRFGVRGGLVPNARYALAIERGEYVGKDHWADYGEVA
ncbi:WhiB family transcription factor [Mycobacterium phage Archie]|uniref:WhiB family transcription factor n=1 Tax=Mycobacterium phage Archie TaxID=1718599 RepID=A0A0M4S2W4_9CAUD|nr:WhiB family transcription factor [Mycobacterium phage Archie]ALF00384.1 WhiB family transcription factor [Mycobacterium phage Archie]